jgi:glycosyltransferase involved in cell wall biosynthesis
LAAIQDDWHRLKTGQGSRAGIREERIRMADDSISVVVPVYNSQDSLETLVNRLEATLLPLGVPYEIILVNDGSRDRSWEVVQSLARQRPHVRGFDLSRNYGQHNALLCGIRAARHGVIVTIDDDLQHPPEEIPFLLAELAKGHEVVYGYPAKERHGLWRDLASQCTKLALKHAMGVAVARRISAFRAFPRRLREAFDNYACPSVSIDVLLSWGTNRFQAVPVRHDPRRLGTSNYTFRKLVVHALNLMTGFTTIPLQLASLLGFACTLFGILILMFVVCRFLIEGQTVPGFSFLASIISIFAGVQLLALGIMGEYMARLHKRTLSQPIYLIRQDTLGDAKSDPNLTLAVAQ